MAMTYTSYVTTMQTMLVVQDASGVANLNAILPNMIDYAELRMYRDLQILNTVTSAIATLAAGTRTLAIPTPGVGAFVVIQDLEVYTPFSATVTTGKANQCERISKEALLAMWPDPSQQDVPQLFANPDNATLLLGPVPDQNYPALIYGTYRPNELSAANTTTILTSLFPDIFIAASMVFGSGYQKNFGAQTEDPQMSSSWEAQYQTLMKGANVEEFMKKSQAPGWTPYQPPAIANPPRQ